MIINGRKFMLVSSSGKTDSLVRICPTCDTICSLILVLNSTTKKENGLFWKCVTLDCKFKEKLEDMASETD